jgi:steroid delta-isomerase
MESEAHLAAAYVQFYEALKPETLGDLSSVVHDDIFFKDPFNEVRGVQAYAAILTHMFNVAPDIEFKVAHCAYAEEICFLRWESRATVKALGKEPWVVQGMSELTFAPDGRVLTHVDHWDAAAQFYERLPILGSVLRLIRRRAAVG